MPSYTVQEEDQFLCNTSLFTCSYMVMGCILIQEVKGLSYTSFYCPGGIPVSTQNFRFIVHIVFLHGCGLHISKTGIII